MKFEQKLALEFSNSTDDEKRNYEIKRERLPPFGAG